MLDIKDKEVTIKKLFLTDSGCLGMSGETRPVETGLDVIEAVRLLNSGKQFSTEQLPSGKLSDCSTQGNSSLKNSFLQVSCQIAQLRETILYRITAFR